MIAGLLLASCALACWPPSPAVAGPARLMTTPLRARLDGSMPALLALAVLGLVVAWNPTPAGIALGAVGSALTFVTLRRRRRARPAKASDEALPLALTVAGLLLRSGTPPGTALAAATDSSHSRSRGAAVQVERRLAMGESPTGAWSVLLQTPELAAVGRAAIRSTDSGAALAQAWEATGDHLRAERRLAAEVRARKVGVRVLAPLGLCFLPSFVCLGVVPMVIGLAGDIL